MTILSKLFSRERSLFYFCVWNDSDRLGFKKWADYNIKNNLFLKDGEKNKVAVYYDNSELKMMLNSIIRKIKSDKMLFKKYKEALKKEWKVLRPYVDNEKNISSLKEFNKYYKSLVAWWSVMTVIWFIPDLKNIPKKIKEEAIKERIASEKYSSKFNTILEKFFIEKFPQYKKYLQVVRPAEVLVLRKRKFSKNKIKDFEERLGGYGLLNGKILKLSELNENLLKQGLNIEKETIKSVNTIKGFPASTGVVKGRVAILIDKKMINKFKKGYVLVTEMTEPEYLPAMKKAVAIITNEGGIACHAAIVARELRKPCIIGTKIATKVLKDGDLVEVDANKGIVKIIKKMT